MAGFRELDTEKEMDMTAQEAKCTPGPETFESLLSRIKSRPQEVRWTDIAWETDLWKARRRAAAVRRPLFIWSMNGNPLGCV